MIGLRKSVMAIFTNLIWPINIIVFIIFSIAAPSSFFTPTNFHYIIYSSTFVGFGVLAQGIVLISGNFDLSLGQMVGLTAIAGGSITASLDISGMLAGVVGIILVLGIGTFLGFVNGILVGKFKLNAFLATLATYMIFSWGALMVSTSVLFDLPNLLLAVGGSKIANVWIAILVFFLMAVVLHFIMNHTRFGSNIYAVGGNSTVSTMCGINRDRVILYTYTLAGLLIGFSALLWTGYLNSIPPEIGEGSIFTMFAGAILGGVSLRGGRGKISGMVGGILFLNIVSTGLTMVGFSPEVIGTLTGILVLAAIGLYSLRGKHAEEIREFLEVS